MITVVESNDPNVADHIEYKEIAREYSIGNMIIDGLIVRNAPECGFVRPVKQPYLEDFCKNSNKYNPIALRLPDIELEDNNSLRTEISIAPNPTHK